MFDSFVKNEQQDLEKAIDIVMQTLLTHSPDSDEYSKTLSHLERLYALKTVNRKPRVSPDTILLVAGNLAGILAIVAYEQKHVMASKALGFLMKAR